MLEILANHKTATYIALGVGSLFHGFPLLTHFGYPADPLWEVFSSDDSDGDVNAFATLSTEPHASLAYVGGMLECYRKEIQEDPGQSLGTLYDFLLHPPPPTTNTRIMTYAAMYNNDIMTVSII